MISLRFPMRLGSRLRRVVEGERHMPKVPFLAVALLMAPATYANDVIGEVRTMTTVYEDTLLDIARENGLGLIELMAVNPGVDEWLPGEGTRIVLPTAHVLPDAPRRGVVVNLAELRLYYFPPDGGPVETFPIGVGRDGFMTPQGQTKIVRKTDGPSWYPTANTRADRPELPAVVPPGPDNPLGEYALYLGWPTYLIHGTNMPWGVGRRVSRGCIRMYPENIEYLFGKIPTGTPVTVVSQSVMLGWHEGDLFIEVHPSPEQVDQIEVEGEAAPVAVPEQSDPDRILAAAGDQIWRLDWPAINEALERRQGIPVRITTDADVEDASASAVAAPVGADLEPGGTEGGAAATTPTPEPAAHPLAGIGEY